MTGADPQRLYRHKYKLARDDVLSEYLVHTGSGIRAVPPGAHLSRGSQVKGALAPHLGGQQP